MMIVMRVMVFTKMMVTLKRWSVVISGEWWEIGKDNFSVTKTCVGIAQMAKHTNTNTMIHMQKDNYKTCVGIAQMAKHANTNTMIHMQKDNYKT